MNTGFSLLAEAQNFTTTGTATTTLGEIGSAIRLDKAARECVVEVKNNSGSIALAEFDVQVKAHASGTWVTVANDFTVADGVMLFASADPEALAAGASSILKLSIGPVEYIRFRAKSASSTASVTVMGRIY